MSKLNEKADQINLLLLKKLTGDEHRTFQAWFLDASYHNSPQSVVAERTGLDKSTVSRHFKKFIKLGIIFIVKKVKRSLNYKLTDTFIEEAEAHWASVMTSKDKKIEKRPRANSKPKVIPSSGPAQESILDDPEHFEVQMFQVPIFRSPICLDCTIGEDDI